MSDLEKEYFLDYFETEGFFRRECKGCGVFFWTRDESRHKCGESPCEEYSFIGNPGFNKKYTVDEMRERFLSFFEDNDHTRIDPYPVAANRWRDDVLLTQASIYDFQPLVTSGEVPPPANPLTISQPCIRMQDIDNVGRTGRHTIAFEMLAHHAFNVREGGPDELAYSGKIYWKDETVRYCDEFLKEMGADLQEVVYIEDPWVGGGNAGPAFEVVYRGLELATLVFMSLKLDPGGEYELKDGQLYSPMQTYIVDTGYGLERWAWVSQGTSTIYEAIYPEMIELLVGDVGIEHTEEEKKLLDGASRLAGELDIDKSKTFEIARDKIAKELSVTREELEQLMAPMEAIYAISDHCRALAFMLGDGIVPSNVGTGYLARMVIRRAERLCSSIGVKMRLEELIDIQAEEIGYNNREVIRDIVCAEIERYGETLERGSRKVDQISKDYSKIGESIPTEKLIELYDSHGIQPVMVKEIAEGVGAMVEIPDDFYSLVAASHEKRQSKKQTKIEKLSEVKENIPKTKRLYYDDQTQTQFDANVVEVIDNKDGSFELVLDQTLFYPEGGGQPSDMGSISSGKAKVRVVDVQTEGGIVFHKVDGNVKVGSTIRGEIDSGRRQRLMRHHTATHILVHSARQLLGEHIRQAGAQKGVDNSRIDIQHYRKLSRENIRDIEAIANKIIVENTMIEQEWLDRHEAEKQYGFDLYQGGIPKGVDIRLIHVAGDVQACAGTHVKRTGDIGIIKIVNTERIQDGVERIIFAAGDAALVEIQRTEDILVESADMLNISPAEVPKTTQRFFEEWKERGKYIDNLRREVAKNHGGKGAKEIEIDDLIVVIQRIDTDMEQLREIANAIVEEGKVAVLGSGDSGAKIVVAVPKGGGLHAGKVLNGLAEIIGGRGGGSAEFAQGGGPEVDRLDQALELVEDIITSDD